MRLLLLVRLLLALLLLLLELLLLKLLLELLRLLLLLLLSVLRSLLHRLRAGRRHQPALLRLRGARLPGRRPRIHAASADSWNFESTEGVPGACGSKSAERSRLGCRSPVQARAHPAVKVAQTHPRVRRDGCLWSTAMRSSEC